MEKLQFIDRFGFSEEDELCGQNVKFFIELWTNDKKVNQFGFETSWEDFEQQFEFSLFDYSDWELPQNEPDFFKNMVESFKNPSEDLWAEAGDAMYHLCDGYKMFGSKVCTELDNPTFVMRVDEKEKENTLVWCEEVEVIDQYLNGEIEFMSTLKDA